MTGLEFFHCQSSMHSDCYAESGNWPEAPYICTAPIKYKFANHSTADYVNTGKATLSFQIINQRADFSFALFTGGLENPKLVAVSDPISFANPKAPLYPRLAHGKAWDEMTVTWTSGYNIDEATPLVEWGWKGHIKKLSPAGTLIFTGAPARTVGWRDPGFIHISFLKDLWPNTIYEYRMGHMLKNGSTVWSKTYSFKSSPYPGQDSLQRVIIFRDMGKAERDGSNEYSSYQPGSLITTDHGNHERDYPNTGSFYNTPDSGGECGVLAETMYYVPADNRAKFGYSNRLRNVSLLYSRFRARLARGYRTICMDREMFGISGQKQTTMAHISAHRVLGYSSNDWLANEGAFEEPMGRAHLQKLWQKYKVDIAFFGHVHNYERTCPIYQNQCVNSEISHYSGTVNGTIHVVVGGGGSHLSEFTKINTFWSLYKDHDWGFVKLTAFNHSPLLFEYKKSADGEVYDSFTISRDYRDVLACVHDGCEATTLAT